MYEENLTPEEIQRQYDAAMDSVNLINGPKPSGFTDEAWADALKRNADHLEIMVAKPYWTDQDMTPLEEAIALVNG